MNERIKELWGASDAIEVCYPEQGSPVSVSVKTLETFAQLIIWHATECVRDVLRDENSDLSYDAASQVQNRIREFFGLNE
jgi:hypothetical protein